jgi:hypothetical protein
MVSRQVGQLKLFTERDLKRLAGRRRFERGQGLLDAIEELCEDEFSLWSHVYDGSATWRSRIIAPGPLSTDCDCPDGQPGSFRSMRSRSASAACPMTIGAGLRRATRSPHRW